MNDLVFAGRTGKFTWRMLATVLVGQSVIVFFGALVARGTAIADGSSAAQRYLVVGSAVALACLVAAGGMRAPWGVTVGWLVQLACLLAGLVVPMMFVVGVIFLALWVVAMVQGHRIDRFQAGLARSEGPDRGDRV